MNRPSRFMKAAAAFLSSLIFFTGSVFAYSGETAMWAERRRALAELPFPAASAPQPFLRDFMRVVPASLNSIRRLAYPKNISPGAAALLESIPAAFGSIRKITSPTNGRTGNVVIHIQDVHMNQEAQRNIEGALQELVDRKIPSFVALEGAFEPIDVTPFRAFPHHGVVRTVADSLLRSNKISGPLHMAFVSPTALPPLIGIDDPNHYRANVEAYRNAAPLTNQVIARLTAEEARLAKQKRSTFNPALAAFDGEVKSYRCGRSAMGSYVQALAKRAVEVPPAIGKFIEALAIESSLNFSQVETERGALLAELLPKLAKAATAELVEASAAFRTGTLSPADFYRYLQGICERNGVRLSRYPAMNVYLLYVLLAESIDGEQLSKDTAALEESVYASLAATPAERRLVDRSRTLYLTGKLVDFSLTSGEWEAYKKFEKSDLNLSAFESFYEEASARDRAMAENLLRTMNGKKFSVAVLVAGGFHSEGIDRRMSDEGVTTITFVPKITKVEAGSGSAYLSVFAREKTPLAKLFEGQKLFLAQEQLPPETVLQAAIDVGASDASAHPAALFSAAKCRLIAFARIAGTAYFFIHRRSSGFLFIGVKVNDGEFHHTAEVFLPTFILANAAIVLLASGIYYQSAWTIGAGVAAIAMADPRLGLLFHAAWDGALIFRRAMTPFREVFSLRRRHHWPAILQPFRLLFPKWLMGLHVMPSGGGKADQKRFVKENEPHLAELPDPRHRTVLELHFIQGIILKKCREALGGVTAQRVSQLKKEALRALVRLVRGELLTLDSPIGELDLPKRALTAMASLTIVTIGDAIQHSEDEFLELSNFGNVTLHVLKDQLTAKGWSLKRKTVPVPEPLPLPRNWNRTLLNQLTGGINTANIILDLPVAILELPFTREVLGQALVTALGRDIDKIYADPAGWDLFKDLSSLRLGLRTRNTFADLRVSTLRHLVTMKRDYLLGLTNFGFKSLEKFEPRLSEFGLRLGMSPAEIAQWILSFVPSDPLVRVTTRSGDARNHLSRYIGGDSILSDHPQPDPLPQSRHQELAHGRPAHPNDSPHVTGAGSPDDDIHNHAKKTMPPLGSGADALNELMGRELDLHMKEVLVQKDVRLKDASPAHVEGLVAYLEKKWGLKNRRIGRDELVHTELQILSRSGDKAQLESYLKRQETQRVALIMDESAGTEFKAFAEKFGTSRVRLSPKKHLFVGGALDRVSFEAKLAELNRQGKLEGALFVLPRDLVEEFAASPMARASLLYHVNYVTLDDLNSVWPDIHVKNLGLIIGIARALGVAA